MSPEEKLSSGISREEQEEDDNQVSDGVKVITVLEIRKCRFKFIDLRCGSVCRCRRREMERKIN